MQSTPKGIVFPLPSDVFPSARWWESHANTVDAAITNAEAGVNSRITNVETGVNSRIDGVEATAERADEQATETSKLITAAGGYVHSLVDSSGVVGAAIRADRVAEIPGGVETPWAGQVGNTADGISYAVTDSHGVMSDLVLDAEGRFPKAKIDEWISRSTLGAEGTLKAPTTKTVGLELSRPQGGVTNNVQALSVKIPFRFAADIIKWRVHIRNFNERDQKTFTAGPQITGMWLGESASQAGVPTGEWVAAPIRFETPFPMPEGSVEHVTAWQDRTLKGYQDYMLAFGVENPAGATYVWQRCGNFQSTTTSHVTESKPAGEGIRNQGPFEVWIEAVIDAAVPTVLAWGDSLTVGTGSEFPVYQSWPYVHARRYGYMPINVSHHGGTLQQSIALAGTEQWTKFSTFAKPDAVIMPLGSNDVFGSNATFEQMKERLATIIPMVAAAYSPRIFGATIMPRNNTNEPSDDSNRLLYNQWLQSTPLGLVGVFDFAASIVSPTDSNRGKPEFYSTDNLHLNAAGYLANVASIPHGVAPSLATYRKGPNEWLV